MKYTAYLMILQREDIPVDEEQIHRELLQMRFDNVRPFEEYDSHVYGKFVVWRYDRDDKLTDEATQELVGKGGYILYVWLCPRCKRRAAKAEHPFNHAEDSQFGCSCPDTAWGCVIC